MLNTLLLSAALSAAPQPLQDAPVSQQAINEAIDRGVQYLLSAQHVDGSWYDGKTNVYPNPEGGATALVVAALLHSGIDHDHQAIVRGAAYARSRPMQMFYGTVTRILMEDILSEHKDERQLKALAEFLVGGASSEYFDYPGLDKPDLSITQYAVLDRNGLRPMRYVVTGDGLVIAGSEAGMVPVDESSVKEKGALGPGQMLAVDTAEGRLYHDAEIKDKLAHAQPYAEWVGKINELLSLHTSEPPGLRVPAANCLGGIREAQTIS